jgi:hypothetical protein
MIRPERILENKPTGKKELGRPVYDWRVTLKRILKKQHMSAWA